MGNQEDRMLPVIGLLCSDLIPGSLWTSAAAAIPYRVGSAYEGLFYALVLLYLPFGLNLMNKCRITSGKIDNLNPRKQSEVLKATHPSYARLCAAEQNMQESFPIFVAAVLSATQA